MEASKNAVFAINGDYYDFRDTGYVLRNGTAYRNSAGENEGFVIDKKGDLSAISESDVSLQSISDKGAWQVLSFEPGLIKNGHIVNDLY